MEESLIGQGSESEALRKRIESLTLEEAVDVNKEHDSNSGMPLLHVNDPLRRASVYLKRDYLFSRQIGHSEDHDTAFIVEGKNVLVIPINDLVDRINLFTPLASMILTLKMALNPKQHDYEFALMVLNDDNFFLESKIKFLRFIEEIHKVIDAIDAGTMRLFLFVADKAPVLHQAMDKLEDLTDQLVEVSPAILAASTESHEDVVKLMELMEPLTSVFNDIANCIRQVGIDAFDPAFTDMVYSSNETMIESFYATMLRLMEDENE